jgi:hypothetical protein
MAGRTADISTSSFKPLSLDEIMMVPLAKQKMEDDFLAGSDKVAALEAQVMAGDKDAAAEVLSGYKNQASRMSQDIIDSGVSRGSFNKLRGLRNEIQTEYGSTGFLGNAIANRKASSEYANAMKTDKERQGGWGSARASLHAARQIADFNKQGSKNADGSFRSFSGSELYEKFDEDPLIDAAIERVAEHVEPATMNLVKVGGLSSVERAFREDKITSKDYNTIMASIRNSAMNNTDLLNSLQQEAYFTGEQDPTDFGDFNFTDIPRVDANGEPVLDSDGKQIVDTKTTFVPGQSRFGRKAAGFGAAASYRNITSNIKILEDPILMGMMNKKLSEENAAALLNTTVGELASYTPASLEKTQELLELTEVEVADMQGARKQREQLLKSQGATPEQIAKDRQYIKLTNDLETSTVKWANAKGRIDRAHENIDAQLTPGEKGVFEMEKATQRYLLPGADGGVDFIAMLKGEFNQVPSPVRGYNQSKQAQAQLQLMNNYGASGKVRGDRTTWQKVLKKANDSRSDHSAEYIKAHPTADFFNVYDGLSAGKFASEIGAINKVMSDNFNPTLSELSYGEGRLEDNDVYKDLMNGLTPGEVPTFKAAMTDGIDNNGVPFKNVLVTTSEGSASFQVTDTENNANRERLAVILRNGTSAQAQRGIQIQADAKHGSEVKRSGFGNQASGQLFLNTGTGRRKLSYQKDPTGEFYEVNILDGEGNVLMPLSDQPIYSQAELSLRMAEATEGINIAKARAQAKKDGVPFNEPERMFPEPVSNPNEFVEDINAVAPEAPGPTETTITETTKYVQSDGKTGTMDEMFREAEKREEEKKTEPVGTPQDQALLKFVGKFESKGGDYNILYGKYKGKTEKPLTEMTISEVFDLQEKMKSSGSSAVGAHQFINSTLREEVEKQGIPLDTKFTPQVQDTIILSRLKGMRGFDKFLSGEDTAEEFALELSREFASMPNPKTGKSYYDGDGLNKSLTGVEEVIKMLNDIKASQGGQDDNRGYLRSQSQDNSRVAQTSRRQDDRGLRQPGTGR